jgi:hypothetical protein
VSFRDYTFSWSPACSKSTVSLAKISNFIWLILNSFSKWL